MVEYSLVDEGLWLLLLLLWVLLLGLRLLVGVVEVVGGGWFLGVQGEGLAPFFAAVGAEEGEEGVEGGEGEEEAKEEGVVSLGVV